MSKFLIFWMKPKHAYLFLLIFGIMAVFAGRMVIQYFSVNQSGHHTEVIVSKSTTSVSSENPTDADLLQRIFSIIGEIEEVEDVQKIGRYRPLIFIRLALFLIHDETESISFSSDHQSFFHFHDKPIFTWFCNYRI